MAAVPCPACHKPMNALAVVCPHCNARRSDIATGTAGKQLSAAEIRALILSDLTLQPHESRGLLPTLLLPHPGTTGAARTAELALTLVALPLVLCGALVMMVTGRDRRRNKQLTGRDQHETRGELAPVVLMTITGGGVLWTLLDLLLHASGTTTAWVLGISVGALVVRAAIRSHETTARSRELDGP